MNTAQHMSEFRGTTSAQIEVLIESYRELLNLHAGDIDSEAFDEVIADPENIDRIFKALRERVEFRSEFTIRNVFVDRRLSPERLTIIARKRGYVCYLSEEFLSTIPREVAKRSRVVLFKNSLPVKVSNDQLLREYDIRGLKPVDPYSLIQLNLDDLTINEYTKPGNITFWKNDVGDTCFLEFGKYAGHSTVEGWRGDLANNKCPPFGLREWTHLWAGVEK